MKANIFLGAIIVILLVALAVVLNINMTTVRLPAKYIRTPDQDMAVIERLAKAPETVVSDFQWTINGGGSGSSGLGRRSFDLTYDGTLDHEKKTGDIKIGENMANLKRAVVGTIELAEREGFQVPPGGVMGHSFGFGEEGTWDDVQWSIEGKDAEGTSTRQIHFSGNKRFALVQLICQSATNRACQIQWTYIVDRMTRDFHVQIYAVLQEPVYATKETPPLTHVTIK